MDVIPLQIVSTKKHKEQFATVDGKVMLNLVDHNQIWIARDPIFKNTLDHNMSKKPTHADVMMKMDAKFIKMEVSVLSIDTNVDVRMILIAESTKTKEVVNV